jgi:hypothetical protein
MTDRAQSIVGYHPEGRPGDDFYPTPPTATEQLIRCIGFPERIWEPACGDGAISRVLESHDYQVISSDLYDHGYGETGADFLQTSARRANAIITNPPYCLAEAFLQHALDLQVRKIALLCKLAFLEGVKRSSILEASPLHYVLVFRRRLQLTRNGESMRNRGMIAFAWFVWERNYNGQPVLRWI